MKPDNRHPKIVTGNQRPFIIPVFLPHAGCPHQCLFCNQSSITGVEQKNPSLSMVRTQIDDFLKYKKKQPQIVDIAFYGGNFLGLEPNDMQSYLDLAREYVLQGKVDSIRFSTRPDTIDRYRLDILKNYPVSTIELGVQSLNDNVLSLSRRGHTAADTMAAVHLLRKTSYKIGLQMMVGLPGDSEKRCLATARQLAELAPDFIRIYPTVVIAGSPLATLYQRNEYTPLTLSDAVGLCAKLYLIFRNRNIPVIRMGLQASQDLEQEKTILAGPYHPAFGHLVYSSFFLEAVRSHLRRIRFNKDRLTIMVCPKSTSRFQGLRNENLRLLKAEFDLPTISVIGDSALAEDEIKINNQIISCYSAAVHHT